MLVTIQNILKKWVQKRTGTVVAGKRRVYVDYAAATPVHLEVFEVMKPYFTEVFGNASSIHEEGQRAAHAVESARQQIARILGVRDTDIIFTSGGTESNNLAIRGLCSALGNLIKDGSPEIITTALEHPSIVRVMEHLKKTGIVVHYAPVDSTGLVDEKKFTELLSPQTVLVSFAYANSETGVVQDLSRIARLIHAYEKVHQNRIVFHTDASQAPLWLPCQVPALGVDVMTLDAGKFCGPKGVGVLVRRPKASLSAAAYGGSQEQGLRPGTENTPLIVGTAKALELAQRDWVERSDRIKLLRDRLISSLTAQIPGCVVNGSMTDRLSNNVNISIPAIDTEFAVVVLDRHGIAASTKSACSGADGGGSIVVKEMTHDEDRAAATIRFSLGEGTTQEDINRVVEVLREHVLKMRSFQKTLSQ